METSILQICSQHGQETLYAFFSYLPVAILSTMFFAELMEQRHSRIGLIFLLVFKQVFFTRVYLQQIGSVYQSRLSFQIVGVLLAFFLNLGLYLTLCYCYKANPIKVLVASILTDLLVTACMAVSLLLVDRLHAKQIPLSDLVIIVPATPKELAEYLLFFGALVLPLLKSLGFLLRRYRKVKIPLNYLTATLATLYYTGGFLSFVSLIERFSGMKPGLYEFIVCISVLMLVVLLYLFFFRESRTLKVENQYLNKQQCLLESYLSELQNQQEKKKKYWDTIEDQIQKCTDLHLEKEEEQIYLEALKKEYTRLKQLEVSNNLYVNALAEKENQICQKKGIQIIWQIQSFPEERAQQKCMLMLLEILCKEGIAQAESVKGTYLEISLGKYKRQWQLQMTCPAAAPISSMRQTKNSIKLWGGYCKVHKKDNRYEITVWL